MKIKLLFILLFLLCLARLNAQYAPSIEWQRCLGGTNDDRAFCIQQTSDSGFIVAGYATSNDIDVIGNHGSSDYWIVRLDLDGTVEWKKCFGGSESDEAYWLEQTTDKGFIVIGSSKSNDGDVTGNHGEEDYWILKLDLNGNIEWKKCYGGSGKDVGHSISQCVDGSFIMTGWSYSNDGDVSGNHGNSDYWILKIDSIGNIIWQKCFGGSKYEEAWSLLKTGNSGFTFTGFSTSDDGDVTGNHHDIWGNTTADYWILNIDSGGVLNWENSLGGSYYDESFSSCEAIDGKTVIVGLAASNDGDIFNNYGSEDNGVIVLDGNGNFMNERSFGGSSIDRAYYIEPTTDTGYIIAGYSKSNDGNLSENHGGYDFWVLKLNSIGLKVWSKCYGGTNDDISYFVHETTDHGYIIVGSSQSADDDVASNYGSYDYWIIKLAADLPTGMNNLSLGFPFSISPNPSADEIHLTFSDFIERHISIYNFLGEEVLREQVTQPSSSISLNISSLAKGTYLVAVRNEEKVFTSKFIKE